MPCVSAVSLHSRYLADRLGWKLMLDHTMVMATVLALVAGGFRIVTRPMERMMARTIKMI